ncbi:pathogenesis-related protein 1-like protein, partial [Leptotrombidium deliense]
MMITTTISFAFLFGVVLCYDSAFNSECVKLHNDARRTDGSPDIRVDQSLCGHAEKRANELANSCAFNHDGNANSGYGENLAAGWETGCKQSMSFWVNEREVYCRERIQDFD